MVVVIRRLLTETIRRELPREYFDRFDRVGMKETANLGIESRDLYRSILFRALFSFKFTRGPRVVASLRVSSISKRSINALLRNSLEFSPSLLYGRIKTLVSTHQRTVSLRDLKRVERARLPVSIKKRSFR